MKKLLFICLLVGGFVWAQGPKSTGKIKYDDKAGRLFFMFIWIRIILLDLKRNRI